MLPLALLLAAPSHSPVEPHLCVLACRARASSIFSAADMTRQPSRSRGITVPIPEAAPALALPPILGPKDPDRPLVVIDAGHGGHDPGSHNPRFGWQEKDITLAIAQRLRDNLLKTGRVRIAMTRDDDHFLVLQERYGIARKMGAALFISLHADAAENPQAQGATIYTLSDVASDREAARLAARENRSDILNGVDLTAQDSSVASILIDLTQRETLAASTRFADLVHRESSHLVRFRTPYHRFASLVVLKAPDTPSVLFEGGYITNDEDAKFLASSTGQAGIASGIARAVTVYFARQGATR